MEEEESRQRAVRKAVESKKRRVETEPKRMLSVEKPVAVVQLGVLRAETAAPSREESLVMKGRRERKALRLIEKGEEQARKRAAMKKAKKVKSKELISSSDSEGETGVVSSVGEKVVISSSYQEAEAFVLWSIEA